MKMSIIFPHLKDIKNKLDDDNRSPIFILQQCLIWIFGCKLSRKRLEYKVYHFIGYKNIKICCKPFPLIIKTVTFWCEKLTLDSYSWTNDLFTYKFLIKFRLVLLSAACIVCVSRIYSGFICFFQSQICWNSKFLYVENFKFLMF